MDKTELVDNGELSKMDESSAIQNQYEILTSVLNQDEFTQDKDQKLKLYLEKISDTQLLVLVQQVIIFEPGNKATFFMWICLHELYPIANVILARLQKMNKSYIALYLKNQYVSFLTEDYSFFQWAMGTHQIKALQLVLSYLDLNILNAIVSPIFNWATANLQYNIMQPIFFSIPAIKKYEYLQSCLEIIAPLATSHHQKFCFCTFVVQSMSYIDVLYKIEEWVELLNKYGMFNGLEPDTEDTVMIWLCKQIPNTTNRVEYYERVLQALINKSGIDINHKNKEGNTVIHYLVLHTTLTPSQCALTAYLLDKGADLTLLSEAVQKIFFEKKQALLYSFLFKPEAERHMQQFFHSTADQNAALRRQKNIALNGLLKTGFEFINLPPDTRELAVESVQMDDIFPFKEELKTALLFSYPSCFGIRGLTDLVIDYVDILPKVLSVQPRPLKRQKCSHAVVS